jgi:enoyl-CoA hydratase/carnithine racemase
VLNRPECRNAINGELQRGIVATFAAFDDDCDARVAVLTGPDPVLCGGMDLIDLGAGRLPFFDVRRVEANADQRTFDNVPWTQARSAVRAAEDEGWATLWLPESLGPEII